MQARDGTPALRLTTERLELRPFSPDAIDALLHRDAARLTGLVSGRFPEPLRPPALMGDILPTMRDRVRAEPSEAAWWAWTIQVAATGQVVGMLGLTGPPDYDGTVLLGYSVYEEFMGKGYASEAVQALARWALEQPGVTAVRSTVPPTHDASIRVAEKAGMRRAGRQADPQWGEVAIYEIRKPGGVERGD